MPYDGKFEFHFDAKSKRLWKLTWGLLLVVALTVISELFPRLGDSKLPTDSRPTASAPALHALK